MADLSQCVVKRYKNEKIELSRGFSSNYHWDEEEISCEKKSKAWSTLQWVLIRVFFVIIFLGSTPTKQILCYDSMNFQNY
jgi:hypothetical protein